MKKPIEVFQWDVAAIDEIIFEAIRPEIHKLADEFRALEKQIIALSETIQDLRELETLAE